MVFPKAFIDVLVVLGPIFYSTLMNKLCKEDLSLSSVLTTGLCSFQNFCAVE